MSFPATLSPPYNALHNILTKGGLPEGIAHNILLMVYHAEHRELLDDMKWDIADRAFCNSTLCEEDPKTATNHFYDCNCCEKHQYNKAVITDVGLMICTKAHHIYSIPLFGACTTRTMVYRSIWR